MSVALNTNPDERFEKATYDAEFDVNIEAKKEDDSLGPARFCIASWITTIP